MYYDYIEDIDWERTEEEGPGFFKSSEEKSCSLPGSYIPGRTIYENLLALTRCVTESSNSEFSEYRDYGFHVYQLDSEISAAIEEGSWHLVENFNKFKGLVNALRYDGNISLDLVEVLAETLSRTSFKWAASWLYFEYCPLDSFDTDEALYRFCESVGARAAWLSTTKAR